MAPKGDFANSLKLPETLFLSSFPSPFAFRDKIRGCAHALTFTVDATCEKDGMNTE
jgi:hypothetical protein